MPPGDQNLRLATDLRAHLLDYAPSSGLLFPHLNEKGADQMTLRSLSTKSSETLIFLRVEERRKGTGRNKENENEEN